MYIYIFIENQQINYLYRLLNDIPKNHLCKISIIIYRAISSHPKTTTLYQSTGMRYMWNSECVPEKVNMILSIIYTIITD